MQLVLFCNNLLGKLIQLSDGLAIVTIVYLNYSRDKVVEIKLGREAWLMQHFSDIIET